MLGWTLVTIGFGLVSLLKYDSSQGAWIGFPIVLGIGLGVLYSSTQFPVMAPLLPSQQAHAMAFFGFVRSFGQVVGVTIGATVLQNELNKSLPASFVESLNEAHGGGAEIAFAAIPVIKTM